MKRALTLLSLVLALAALPVLASAQEISANIPFAFTVRGKQFDAGRYDLSRLSAIGAWTLRDSNRNYQLIFQTVMEDYPRDAQPKLMFHRYGEEYFLTQIWTQSLGVSVPESRQEAQVRARVGRPVVVALLMKR